MKTAPITVTEIVLVVAGGIALYGAFRAYKAFSNTTISSVASDLVNAGAVAVDVRDTQPTSVLGTSQNWFADTVQKGQDAGSTTFVGSFFNGLFK
jgi:hypothetical protein